MISTMETTSKNYEKKTQKHKMNQILLDKDSSPKENTNKTLKQLNNFNGNRKDTQLTKFQLNVTPFPY